MKIEKSWRRRLKAIQKIERERGKEKRKEGDSGMRSARQKEKGEKGIQRMKKERGRG